MGESSTTPPSKYIRNPATGRMILRTGQTGRRILKEAQCEKKVLVPKVSLRTAPQPTSNPLRERMTDIASDVLMRNKEKFKADLSDAQTDELLKRLLYEKLCVSKKPKRKKKKHYVSSSEESESESD